MAGHLPIIVFIDNSMNRIFKSIEALKIVYKDIVAFNNEEQALEFISSHNIDLLFLNLDLLPDDAVTFTKEILQKKSDPHPFIIIYSDKQDDFVQELAFNSGVDSFINFHNKPAVLQLFIKNLLGRRKIPAVENKRSIVIDRDRYVVMKKGETIHLPRKEFKIFELLYNSPQKFFSKMEIAMEIWDDSNVAGKRIIDVHIYNIRQFFGKRVIQSQKGRGYRINSKYV
jgi:two-component system alkaline phosphatase synthesis response regulator PhoP